MTVAAGRLDLAILHASNLLINDGTAQLQAVTAASLDGAAIGGVTPAAGAFTSLSSTGILTQPVAATVSASTTQTRGQGPLTAAINVLSTVANTGDAVTLPALTAGQAVAVFNAAGHAASVFPNGSADTIDGGTGGAKVTLTNAKRCLYFCVAAGVIVSAQLGVASA